MDDKTVISSLRWYASDRTGWLITVGGAGGVGDDFSQTVCSVPTQAICVVDIDGISESGEPAADRTNGTFYHDCRYVWCQSTPVPTVTQTAINLEKRRMYRN